MINWTTAGHADADAGLVNHFTMLGATFATKYAVAKINGAAAGMAAQRTATRKLWLQQANTYLVQQLLQSIEQHDLLCHVSLFLHTHASARSDQFAREMQQMRSEDAYDDDLIAQELALEEHTVEQENWK